MTHLRAEIEKIFNEIDKNLQNDKENSMTIYDCFDFQEEDKDKFIDAIFILLVLFDYNIKSNFACRLHMAKEIIKCDKTLAQMIIDELWDKKFITFERCKDVCNFLDAEFEEYKRQNPPTPLEELAKDYPYLSKLVKAFNKKV